MSYPKVYDIVSSLNIMGKVFKAHKNFAQQTKWGEEVLKHAHTHTHTHRMSGSVPCE